MNKKILVVDDEPNLLKMVESRLSANGYKVITARDGQEGFDKAKAEKPDLILLDIIMPKMDGEAALKKLKADDATKSIPVVMLTAKGDPEDIVKNLVYLGATDYIVKPYIAIDFLKKVDSVLGSDKEAPGTCQFMLETIEEKLKKTLDKDKEK